MYYLTNKILKVLILVFNYDYWLVIIVAEFNNIMLPNVNVYILKTNINIH